jgi:hypothetical protein
VWFGNGNDLKLRKRGIFKDRYDMCIITNILDVSEKTRVREC